MNPQMFNVLSEPNRLDIVELLYNNPQSVNEIVYKLKLNQPQVSKHLKILHKVGIVDVKPVKNLRIYELNPGPFKQIDNWLKKYRKMWEDRFDRLDKLLIEEKEKASQA